MRDPFDRDAKAENRRPLTGLSPGEGGRVVHLGFDDPERMVKLSGFGLVPGANIELVQRRPTFVIRVGETSVAIDRDIAAGILVGSR